MTKIACNSVILVFHTSCSPDREVYPRTGYLGLRSLEDGPLQNVRAIICLQFNLDFYKFLGVDIARISLAFNSEVADNSLQTE